MDKTRIGFIGVGGIAHRHLDILAGFDDVALVAFADPDLGRASEAASRFGAKAFASHQAMLDDDAAPFSQAARDEPGGLPEDVRRLT